MGIPDDFMVEYEMRWQEIQAGVDRFPVLDRQPRYNVRPDHPMTCQDCECAFCARQLSLYHPPATTGKVLSIGSYEQFIMGLLAGGYCIWSVDVQARQPATTSETVITCDAKKLELMSDSFDLVISQCALEHFGLERYGDEFDLEADLKAFTEMVRVLKPGGAIIFSTGFSRAPASCLAFNAHRTYSLDAIRLMCQSEGLVMKEEAFVKRAGRFCSLEEVSQNPLDWDIYCGNWIKAAA